MYFDQYDIPMKRNVSNDLTFKNAKEIFNKYIKKIYQNLKKY